MKKRKILVTALSRALLQPFLQLTDPLIYQIEIAATGSECLEKIASFAPDLLISGLMLPEIHAIEILKKIRSQPKTRNMGVIIASYNTMIQNFNAAINAGADFFLCMPCSPEHFVELIERYFAGTLKPEPFSGKVSSAEEGDHCYLPPSPLPVSYLKFWGTRGSTPVSGSDYIHFGGNTCCLEIRQEKTLLIIDAGTGIRALGRALTAQENVQFKTIHLFLGHTHWDHILGFPFFSPLYHSDVEIVIWAPVGFEKSTRELFTEMFAYDYFPVRLDDIQAKLTFKEMHSQEPVTIDGITIDTQYTFHPGITFCFKVKMAGQTFGYVTDNEFLLGYHGNPKLIAPEDPQIIPYQELIKFFNDCDFMVHEAQYTPLEYQQRVGWGHSSVSNAALFIKLCQAKKWYVTHHDPLHKDSDLEAKKLLHEAILEDLGYSCPVEMLYDGYLIPIH